MGIKKVNVAKENINTNPYKINKSFIARGLIIAGLITGITSVNPNAKTNQTTQPDIYSLSYYEEHQEQFPILKIRAENTEAIQSEKVKMVITNQDDLLIEYIKIYPDGYINIDETYIYPGDEYSVVMVYNDEESKYTFSMPEQVEDNEKYELVLDCETREIRVVPISHVKEDNTHKSL